MSYFKNLGNATSQWLNALSGGNPDIPMSARIGYYSYNGYLWFKIMEWVVDVSFFPIDGVNHCLQAWESDSTEGVNKGSIWSIAFMSLFTVAGSICIAPFTWGYYLIKLLIKNN